MMVVLVDFDILIIIEGPLRVILAGLLGELYTLYFSYEIHISNGLKDMRGEVKV